MTRFDFDQIYSSRCIAEYVCMSTHLHIHMYQGWMHNGHGDEKQCSNMPTPLVLRSNF